jgi:hypothetical protein
MNGFIRKSGMVIGEVRALVRVGSNGNGEHHSITNVPFSDFRGKPGVAEALILVWPGRKLFAS